MTDLDPLFIKRARALCVTNEETARIGGALSAFMRKNPVNMQKALLKKAEPSRSSGGFLAILFSLQYRPILAAVLLLVLGTGGLSYAAEYALPGDALYTVKIHVNEAVQVQLAVSAEAKAEVNAEHAARRMEEAEQLAAIGRLTPEASTQLMTDFNAHAEEMRTNIQKIAASGDRAKANSLNTKTEEALHTHLIALTTLNTKNAKDRVTRENIALLVQTVKQAADETIALNTSINGDGQIAMQATPMAMMQANPERTVSKTIPSEKTASEGSTPAFVPTIIAPKPPVDAIRQDVETTTRSDANQQIHTDHVTTLTTTTTTKTSIGIQQKTMMFLKTTATGATSSATGSASINTQNKRGTPVKIEIKKDGKLDVHIVTGVTGSGILPR